MAILVPLLASLVGYLSGSVNYAIIVTKAVTGGDIREMGNHVPGMSNVLRTVGKKWGALVCALDALKGLVPLVLARAFLFPADASYDFGCLYLVGIAAVLGHCKPLFHGFRGGGGIATFLGVSLFFVPVEFLFSMLVGGLVSMRFFKKAEHMFTQWTPVMFTILTPFVTLATTLWLDIPLFLHLSIGGHPWTVAAGAFVMSFMLLGLNTKFMKRRATEYQEIQEGSASEIAGK